MSLQMSNKHMYFWVIGKNNPMSSIYLDTKKSRNFSKLSAFSL